MMLMPGFMEVFAVLFAGGLFSSGGLLGMPPGERDEALVRTVGEDAIVYVEWSARAEGKPGAKGIDGLAADPEVKEFIHKVKQAILEGIEKETSDSSDPLEQALGEAVPPIVLALLNQSGCVSVSYNADNVKLDPAVGPDPIAFVGGLNVTIVFNAGDDADEVGKNIEKILGFLPAGLRGKGINKQKLPIPLPGASLTLHRHENYFIIGFGENTVENAVAGIKGDRKGLADNERFNDALSGVKVDRLGSIGWLDVRGVLERVTKILGPQGQMVTHISKAIGADALDSIINTSGVVDGQVVSNTFVTTGGSVKGILALAAGRGLTGKDVKHIPVDADFVLAFSLSLPKVYAAVQEVLGAVEPQSAEFFKAIVAGVEAELGLSLEEDFFGAFGDAWTIYDSPSAGGVFVTSLVASVEVKDAEKAYRVLSSLMQILKASLPGDFGGSRRRGVFLAERKFEDRTVYYINTVGDDDIPFAPAFCVTNSHLLIALNPQNLKSHLRWVAEENEKTFADAASIESDAGDVLKFVHCDTSTVVRYLYSFAPYVAQIVLSEVQREGFDIDIFSFPSARAILPYMSDSQTKVIRTKTGLKIEQAGPLPIGMGSAVLVNVPVLLFWSVGIAADAPVRGDVEVRAIAVEAAPAQDAEVIKEAKPKKADDKNKKPRVKRKEKTTAKPKP